MFNIYKYIVLSSLLLSIFQIASGQPFLNNDSLSFKVLRQSTKIKSENEATPVMYLIKVNLSTEQRREVEKIKKEDWLKLLASDNTDWIANLILYDLFRKNAISYSGNIKNRKEWIEFEKRDEDIEYWKKKLTSK